VHFGILLKKKLENWSQIFSISAPQFLRLQKSGEEREKKNYVLQRNSGMMTPNILARKSKDGTLSCCETGAETEFHSTGSPCK
jgi:hypothetical protein